ncbi:hypothetical protein, partial [Enterobacter hormaechei]
IRELLEAANHHNKFLAIYCDDIHTLAVAALMPLSTCRSSPLITGARLALALLYRHTLFIN